mmetsp:Transcript_7849/g.18297  ORF Transcript_7849/g.18297 Transcript_7849/m.18297 type:complete len:1939 (+) Transcript_7849:104-5920(+)
MTEPSEAKHVIRYLRDGVLEDRKQHKHLTFHHERFRLVSIEELFQIPNLDLSHLESLDVSNNELKNDALNVIVKSRDAVRSLRTLKAQHNEIQEVILNLPSLTELDLSYNKLSDIPPMSGMPEVESLSLSHNQMKGSWKTLSNTKSLKKLDLSYNHFDHKPSELNEQLDTLQELFTLRILKIKGNAFARTFPEYQSMVLLRLKTLERFDDMEKKELQEAMEAAQVLANVKPDKLDADVYDRAPVHGVIKKEKEEKGGIWGPSWGELCAPIQEALEDESQIGKAIQQFVRLTSMIKETEADKMDTLFRDLKSMKQEKVQDQILSAKQQFLGNFQILLSRVDNNDEHRVMLLRSLAKLSVVTSNAVGDDCMRLLALLLKKSEEIEKEILEAVREIVVEPLKHRTVMDPQFMPAVQGLALFDSKLMPETLAPIAAWLAKQYCNSGASPQRYITQLLATVTQDPKNTEAAINYDAGTLGAGAQQKEQLPQHVMLALENKQLSQNESLREQYMGHLRIVQNTCQGPLGARVVETYEERQLHRDLIKSCKTFFGDGSPGHPDDKGGKTRRNIDISKMKTLDVRTCAALLDCLSSLMNASQDIMQDLMDNKIPHVWPIVDYFLISPKAQVSDPVLLASSLRGIRLILDKYSHENTKEREKVMNKIIEELDSMKPMMEYLDGQNRKYKALWVEAEKHQADKSGDGAMRRNEALSPPRFTALTNELVHTAFEAIVRLVEYFTAEAKTDLSCQEVSSTMNTAGREKLLFKLLQVPSERLKRAVMTCVNKMPMMELSSEEVAYLIDLLRNSKDVTSEESLLEKVIQQLKILAVENSGRGAGAYLRNEHAARAVNAVATVLLKNQARDTYGEEQEEHQKTLLAKACVQFLEVAGKAVEFRAHMRNGFMDGIITDVLRHEDTLSQPDSVDCPVERTWTGRAVETLMQVLAGRDRLKPNGKVAFRVINRMADILEGRSDQDGEESEERYAATELAKEEVKMWDVNRMKYRLRQMNSDVEFQDRMKQQELFATFTGIDRVLQFLLGLEAHEVHEMSRMLEHTQVEDAKEFLAKTMENSKEKAVEALDMSEDAIIIRMAADEISVKESDGHARVTVIRVGGRPETDVSVAFRTRPDTATEMDFERKFGTLEFKNGEKSKEVKIKIHEDVKVEEQERFFVDLHEPVKCLDPGEDTRVKLDQKHKTTSVQIHDSTWIDVSKQDDAAENDPDNDSDDGLDDEEPDRQLLMHGFVDILNVNKRVTRPELQGGLTTTLGIGKDLTIREHFFDDERVGYVNKAFIISAFMRCCHAMLKLPGEDDYKAQAVKVLRDPVVMASMVTLVRMVGPFDCCIAAKFLRITSLALELPPSQSIEDPQIMVLFDIVSKYYCWVGDMAVMAMKQMDDPALPSRGRMLSTEVARVVAVVAKAIPVCFLEDTEGMAEQYHRTFVEACFLRVLPLVVVKALVQMIQHDPHAVSAHDSALDDKMLKDMDDQSLVMELGRQVISLMLDKCPKLKQDILMIFSILMVVGEVGLQKAFISGLLAEMAQGKDKTSIQSALKVEKPATRLPKSTALALPATGSTAAAPAPAPRAAPAQERTLLFVKVEYYNNHMQHKPYDPSNQDACLACVVTDERVLIVDTSTPGYPHTPSFVSEHKHEDMTRIVKGTCPQVLHIGWLTKDRGRVVENFMRLICHRESDRKELMGTLHALSMPAGGHPKDRVPKQEDRKFREDLESHVTESIVVMVFAERIDAQGQSLPGMFVLSESQLYEFKVNFEHWVPPAEASKDNGGDGDDGDAGSDDERGAGGRADEDNRKGKSIRKDHSSRTQILPKANGRDLASEVEEITGRRRAARRESQEGGAEELRTSIAGGRGDVFSQRNFWFLTSLRKIALSAGGRPKIKMEMDPAESGKHPESIQLQFFDDLGREAWKRSIFAQITRIDQRSTWTKQSVVPSKS